VTRYDVSLSRRAAKDATALERVGLKPKAVELLRVLAVNPFTTPPPYEKLRGLENVYSRRINRQHRLVYEVVGETVKVIRMWSHYE
jgi:Txe/YoeB family toxin of toxin-antitoxin system